MLRLLSAIHTIAISSLAVFAGLLIVFVLATVIFDVGLRVLGFQPPAWPIPFSEYMLLYITMLGGPWLLRRRGHVVVESLRTIMPQPIKRTAEVFAYVVGALTCFAIAWFAGESLIESINKGYQDARAVVVPKAILFLPMFLCFLLMGVEFCRYLFRKGSLYGSPDSPTERI